LLCDGSARKGRISMCRGIQGRGLGSVEYADMAPNDPPFPYFLVRLFAIIRRDRRLNGIQTHTVFPCAQVSEAAKRELCQSTRNAPDTYVL